MKSSIWRDLAMQKNTAIVAVFNDHEEAEDAIRKLSEDGMEIKHFSIVGKGYHTEEKVVGFYNTGETVKFWGKNGVIWGGLWGLFFGGIFMTIPVLGPVMVVGHFAAMVFAALEGAVVFGGLGAIGGALVSLGIPKNSVIEYEDALKVEKFLLVAHGPAEEMARAKGVLERLSPYRLDQHDDMNEMAAPPVNLVAHSH
jgi:uncharacterized membrane protein